MSSRGVLSRDRLRRDTGPSRFEDSTMSGSSSKRANNPPSRHLWIGNLSHSLGEHDLTDRFLQFGDLDSVAFQPGRNYAFINFKNDDDAIEALKALQGFPLAGNPLRIEYAKADKATVTSRDEDYLQRRDDQRSALRGSPFSQKDSRVRNASPEPFYGEKSKISDRNAEPSEVLWIGFPASLKVDEMTLRKAFSPFGEVEKITVFPGRSYAFLRFRNINSACRAKETLQGRLFGNPRVHICFARSEGGSSSSGRSPISPHPRSNGHLGASENFRHDRNFGSAAKESSIRSPNYASNLDSDSDVYGFNRKGALYPGGSNTFDNWRFEEDLGPPPDAYERRGSPPRERAPQYDEFPQKLPQKASYFEEPWDLAEDSHLLHGAKKLKTGSFLPENELPEYNLSDLEQEKRSFPQALSDFSPPKVFDRNYGYIPQPDHPNTLLHTDRSDHLKRSYDNYQSGTGSMLPNPVERKRFTPELWKWEGTIAKGGARVCHAQAFPVGKALDMMLPEILDCTARTGLDMLAKHYYQAASVWVVFFSPASDDDIEYFNEFRHYLEEKQRAAVAKLDDKTTLFLVPPSEFSEKVLRVPGTLCISGVILRLELPNSNLGSLHHPNERRDTNLMSFHGDAPNVKPSTPLGHFSSMEPFTNLGRSGGGTSLLKDVAASGPPAAYSGSAHAVGRMSDSYNDNRHNYPHQQRNPTPGSNWSPHHPQNMSDIRNTPSQAPNIGVDPIMQEHHSVPQMMVSQNDSAYYTENISSNPLSRSGRPFHQETSAPPSLPISGLQPHQLAQLASSILGQQGQGSNPKLYVAEDITQTNTSQLDHQFRTAQSHGLQNNQIGSEISTSMFEQLQQLQQQQQQPRAVAAVPVKREAHQGTSGNSQMQNTTNTQEEADGDTEKRLHATLQLAAALLQRIQQGKGT